MNTLKRLEISGFKSFAKTIVLEFPVAVSAIVGPNGSGKSNVAEAMRWVLGEQSMKSLRGKKGEDLIFNGSSTAPRLGKATVSLVFDNRNKVIPVDYEEIIITRKIFRDGMNEYLINGSKVRLKDVIELLSNVGLGSSFHHIISQGEADRILSASSKERKQMLEEALGLKLYQIKKQESERKLTRTKENIEQVEALRREIQPHLRFLKKQAEKAEKTVSVREDLHKLYLEYFSKESTYIKTEKEKIESEKHEPEQEIHKIEKEISVAPKDSRANLLREEVLGLRKEINEKEPALSEMRVKRNSLEREIGRFEGMIELEESKLNTHEESDGAPVPVETIKRFVSKLNVKLEEGIEEIDVVRLKNILQEAKSYLHVFLSDLVVKEQKVGNPNDLEVLKNKLTEVSNLVKTSEEKEKIISQEIDELRQKIEEKNKEINEAERNVIEMEAHLRELKSFMYSISTREESIRHLAEDFEREKQDARALLGETPTYESHVDLDLQDWRHGKRDEMRHQMERLKIKLEDSGAVGEDVLKEYNDVVSRDEFLQKEMSDLENALGSVKEMIAELDEKIKNSFDVGLEKINKEFQDFLNMTFGGGKGELKVIKTAKRQISESEDEQIAEMEQEDQPEQAEDGVEIVVSLPKKKISSIDMLSGGERALTSIALLFAMTQVNPPPFLILDETDAALDEANSRKYGDMIESLSKKTQLIIITHNRETMRRADVLYGVTMGSDSISKLLSIKFTEAEVYSK